MFGSSAPQFLCAELTLEDSLVFLSSQRGMPVLNNSQDFRTPWSGEFSRELVQGVDSAKEVCAIQEQNSNISQLQIQGIPQSCVFQAEPLLLSAGPGPYFVLGNLESMLPIQVLPNVFWSCQIFSVC